MKLHSKSYCRAANIWNLGMDIFKEEGHCFIVMKCIVVEDPYGQVTFSKEVGSLEMTIHFFLKVLSPTLG